MGEVLDKVSECISIMYLGALQSAHGTSSSIASLVEFHKDLESLAPNV